MTNYQTLENTEYLSDLAEDGEMSQFDEDVMVSVGFQSEDGGWKEAYLQSDPNEEFLEYEIQDFEKKYGGEDISVEVHRSKVVKGKDLNEALHDLDPQSSSEDMGVEELDDLF